MRIFYLFAKFTKKIQLPAILDSNIHKSSKVMSSSNIINVGLSKYSYIGNNCTVVNAIIGSFCSIADNCIIGGASHPIDWVSTSPVFHSGKNILKTNFSEHLYETTTQTIIGNDVWIGNNCLIKSGITINNGAIIGMGSVVTKDVGEYEIWGGNPAKYIKKRFPESISEALSNIQWWNFNDNKLKEYSFLMNTPEKLIEKVGTK